MATLQLGADGQVISEDFSEPVGDPSAEPRWTDQQLADALPFVDAKNSPEQTELDGMMAQERYLVEKANEVTGYTKDNVPIYAQPEHERQRLLRAAKGMRQSLEGQLPLSNRALAARYLDSQAQAAAIQQQAADHDALEQRAQEILKEDQARELADKFRSRIRQSNGTGMKIS